MLDFAFQMHMVLGLADPVVNCSHDALQRLFDCYKKIIMKPLGEQIYSSPSAHVKGSIFGASHIDDTNNGLRAGMLQFFLKKEKGAKT